MAFSDADDEEVLPEIVSDYYFYDAEDNPVSFAKLPVQWSNGERSHNKKTTIYLKGNTDNGLQRLHKQVKAWKYEFFNSKPEISVLSKDNNWIKLQKPRKSFENKIRTILITVHCLHFFKRKPKASCQALRDHLCKVFSLYDVRPSEKDLMDHLNFIREAIKRDRTLQTSKFLASLLRGRLRNRIAFDQNVETVTKPSFIVDDTIFEYNYKDDDAVNDDDFFDTVCAICDNGGELTCCEGTCLRSFHSTVKSAKSAKSRCKSLGLPEEEVKGSHPFICLNCAHEQHQCFVCRRLGSSNKSSGAEVFCCNSATCGHFYHPHCVARLLEDEGEIEAHNLEQKIARGDPFTCPAHKCHKCKQEENEKVKALQFAVCRRCPRSYHRKCLPSKILFDNEDNDEDVVARAWNNLLPKSRVLIFCLRDVVALIRKHKMDLELGTPVRNIKFPEIDHCWKNVAVNEDGKSASLVRPGDSSRKRAEVLFQSERVKKQRVSVTYKTPVIKNLSIEAEKGFKKDHIPFDENEQAPVVNENDNFPSIDTDSRGSHGSDMGTGTVMFFEFCLLHGRISALIKDAAFSMTLYRVERHYGITPKDPYLGAANIRPSNASKKPEAAQEGCNQEACIGGTKKYGRGFLSQSVRCVRSHHGSGFSTRHGLGAADASACNRFSTFAMNRYTPRLDELNHTWTKNMAMANVSMKPLNRESINKAGEDDNGDCTEERRHDKFGISESEFREMFQKQFSTAANANIFLKEHNNRLKEVFNNISEPYDWAPSFLSTQNPIHEKISGDGSAVDEMEEGKIPQENDGGSGERKSNCPSVNGGTSKTPSGVVEEHGRRPRDEESSELIEKTHACEEFDRLAKIRDLTDVELNKWSSTLFELKEFELLKLKDLKQKSRVKWALEGDENSSFFHGIMNANLTTNRINGVSVNGVWKSNPKVVKNVAWKFFKEKMEIRPPFTGEGMKKISLDDGTNLIPQFSMEEIKMAVWDCGGDRARGPDGFNFSFLKIFWDLLRNDFYQVLMELYEPGQISKGCGSSFIHLIPENNDPQSFSEFRPISLISFKLEWSLNMREDQKDMLKEEFDMFKHIQEELVASLINRFESL
ncbi:uncharacterized protein LOC143596927 [Bidens hawaiensis]|uniref:uncharacterized protein LOC143596927 n=1 Tax=Bidens hawaiensis TaxID=980011 RepID=UPI00404B05AC